jgi:Zn-dependent peptidase ImmA (M78 family)
MLPLRETERGTIFFRSMAASTKTARTRAESRFAWLQDITEYLTEFVELPEADFPVLSLPEDPLLISDDDIEEAAANLRAYWNLGELPIANMVSLLENKGAIIARGALGAETLDSLSEFAPGQKRPFILIGTDKGTSSRWRFDAAHELGHIILHAHVPPSLLAKADRFKLIESQAHRFAGAFLLPCASFGDDLYGANLDNFKTLKLRWKISISAMVMRARQCGMITEETERRLWINLSRRGWRKLEPYDDTMPPEEPRLLRSAIELILEQGGQTPDEILGRLALSSSDLESLTGLPDEFLTSFSRVSLRQQSFEAETTSETSTAQIIPLRPRRRTV